MTNPLLPALTQLTAEEAYTLLEEALEAGRITPARFRELEAVIEESEAVS